MAIVHWSPFWMDDAFENFFENKSMTPPMDVYEKNNKVFIETPLPGIDPKKVKVNIEDGVLTIKGEKEKKSEVEEKNYYRKEVRHGSFYRAVRLPAGIREDEVDAKFKGGVLTVSVPKKAKENPKKSVHIKVEEE